MLNRQSAFPEPEDLETCIGPQERIDRTVESWDELSLRVELTLDRYACGIQLSCPRISGHLPHSSGVSGFDA
jgi:hypothetical protein